jgi:hypothetical protein
VIDDLNILYFKIQFIFSLKNETTRTVENLDHQLQEQEKLRQNARTMLSILQRTKVQLIELRPTVTGESDQKLKVRILLLNELKSFFFVLEN